MPISFTGLTSVLDRTLFTNRGPIVKKSLPLLTGGDLEVISATDVEISSGSFISSAVGKTLTISGSPDGRNDGTFPVTKVISQKRLRLDSSLDITDIQATTDLIVGLTNELKHIYNLHRTQENVHGSPDTVNPVTAQNSVNLASAVILLNDIRAAFVAHVALVSGSPPVHLIQDTKNIVRALPAHGLESALLLVNDLRRQYEAHRQDLDFHLISDSKNRTGLQPVKAVIGSGPLVGPLVWTINDPRTGQVANDPSDVNVLVNSTPASVDAVFGLLGAVVLTYKPAPTDIVTVDYDYLNDPPVKFKRLNSFEFVLNQDGNSGKSGFPGFYWDTTAIPPVEIPSSYFPGHQYKVRSYLVDPVEYDLDIQSSYGVKQVGWKYKGLERAYSAVLNDPSSLLLNVPSNVLAYPVLDDVIYEITIRYDPVALPQNSTDPWKYEGEGILSLTPGGHELVVSDTSSASGPDSLPPFFSHAANLQYDNVLNSAFRVYVDEKSIKSDGVFSGVGFGTSDGYKATLVGFIQTRANNLSSAIVFINQIKAKYDAHLVSIGVHRPNDDTNSVDIVDATNQDLLIILANRLKILFNRHLALGVGGDVHIIPDTVNPVTAPDAEDLPTAITLVNALGAAYDSHIIRPSVHYVVDTNVTTLVKQVGILKSGYPELQESWESYAVNWTQYVTYRLERQANGDAGIYLSGSVEPIASVIHADLPIAANIDMRINEMQQVFFGALGRQSTSTSYWAFARININPTNTNQIGQNKSVSYTPVYVPELDPTSPWINIGQSGFERINGATLVSDSTASAVTDAEENLGRTTGPYKGYLRLEPILSDRTTSIVEFRTCLTYWTAGVDNKSAGVFIDDGLFSTHLLFLQASPTAATVTGTSSEPLGITSGDTFIYSIGDANSVTVSFTVPTILVSDVVDVINAAAGFVFASSSSGYLKLTSLAIGAQAKFRLLGGTALAKLGLNPGTYFGGDSNPEPKVSWFGENFPDLDTPTWVTSGHGLVEILNRTLRITDNAIDDFRSYSLVDTLYMNPALSNSSDWKVDARLSVLSFQPGNPIGTGSGLKFCGVLINADEGSYGKNIELHLSVGAGNDPFLNVLSYNPFTGELESRAEYPFAWNDGAVHTYNIFTSKGADLVIILVDNVSLGTISYSGLNPGSGNPSLNFGSGAQPISNADLRTSKSVVDWYSVCAFRDSKLSDPTAASKRFIGIYNGGNPNVLSSYYLSQVDWSNPHTYRIVRDPISNVSVYVDGGPTPVISVNYDTLRLPPVSNSFLSVATSKRQCIAFGSFNEHEISRSIWSSIYYSLGKITISDQLVPPHNVLNQANVIASPEHLRTKVFHTHHGFNTWSGGTPLDDFITDASVPAAIVLGETTPPVPKTQNLEDRGGLITTVTPVVDVPALTIINAKGFLSDFADDDTLGIGVYPVITQSDAEALWIARLTDLQSRYTSHIGSTSFHLVADSTNVLLLPIPVTVVDGINVYNEIVVDVQGHASDNGGGYHVHIDDGSTPNSVMSLPICADFYSAQKSTETFVELFNTGNPQNYQITGHIRSAAPHLIPATPAAPVTYDPVTVCVVLLNQIKAEYNLHVSDANLHSSPGDTVTNLDAVDLSTACSLAISVRDTMNAHLVGSPLHHLLSDYDNLVQYPDPTDAITLADITQLMKQHFNAHRTHAGSHGHDDTVNVLIAGFATDLTSAISLINDVHTKYDAHLVQSGVHLASDTIHFTTLPNATDLASAIRLATEIRNVANPHFTYSIHPATDATNYVSATATNLAELIVLVNDLATAYTGHISNIEYKWGVWVHSHGMNDTVNVVTQPSVAQLVIGLAEDFKSVLNIHEARTDMHQVRDTWNQMVGNASYNLVTDTYDFESMFEMLSGLQINYDRHLNQAGVHLVYAPYDFVSSEPSNTVDALSFIISMRAAFDAHIQGFSYHIAIDTVDTPSSLASRSPMDETAVVLNRLKTNFNNHVVNSNYHVKADPDDVVDASDVVSTSLSDMYALANALKASYNSHRAKSGTHVTADIINTVTASDATDEQSLTILTNDLVVNIPAHGIQEGVHGSSVVIRLDPPDRVLYDNMRFSIVENGEPGHAASISDDRIRGTLFDTITLTTTTIMDTL